MNKKLAMTAGGLAAGVALAFGLANLGGGATAADRHDQIAVVSEPESPLSEILSGYEFAKAETQALQDDDFDNPGFLWLEQGQELWDEKDGAAGKSCATCHDDAAESMAGVGASYPVHNAKLGRMVNIENQINMCRKEHMRADPWKYDSDQLLGMTVFVRNQSAGMPMSPDISGPAREFWEKGRDFYYERRGQLDMACAHCHEDNYGKNARANLLSQGQSNGFPTYRLKWQKVGSLHRRFSGCNKQIRAIPFEKGSEEYTNLELYLNWRGSGLPVETPAVRN